MTRLNEMAGTARKLANDLFGADELVCFRQRLQEGSPSCTPAEYDRPLTRAEKSDGWAARPFGALDHHRLCTNCAAYFFAERAAQILHEADCLAERRKAMEERAG